MGGLVGGVPCRQSGWVREKGSALRLLTQGVTGQHREASRPGDFLAEVPGWPPVSQARAGERATGTQFGGFGDSKALGGKGRVVTAYRECGARAEPGMPALEGQIGTEDPRGGSDSAAASPASPLLVSLCLHTAAGAVLPKTNVTVTLTHQLKI